MNDFKQLTGAPGQGRQQGMVLLVALVMLLLITMIGISSMQNATMQEKMTASVQIRTTTFQSAEAALRVGENAVAASTYSLTTCTGAQCAPPAEYNTVIAAGANSTSGVTWVAVGTTGFYAVQNLGAAVCSNLVNSSSSCGSNPTLYRITAIGFAAATPLTNPRSVVESIYAKY